MILNSYYRLVSFDNFTYICSKGSICYGNKNKLLLTTTFGRMHNWHTCKRERIHAQIHIEVGSQTVENSVWKISQLVTTSKQRFKPWAANLWSASLCMRSAVIMCELYIYIYIYIYIYTHTHTHTHTHTRARART